MLITNDAFLISLKLLVLSTAKRWDTLLRCHTQLIQLNKHSVKKKEESYVFKKQCRWQPPLSAMLMWFVLTEQHTHSHWHCCCSHHLRWQWERYCCIQNSEQRDHTTCSYCNIHWNVLMYNDWWILTWFDVIHFCTNETFTLSSMRMVLV